ncbi:conserved hypothetical protein [Nitrosomonas mobilis]|uniref:DUF4434 domain-containing protein n=1 Tax=Nitrosomonas mobilis TaxID=51642 RepID=A0A1G5SJR5_9PROT|nr:conserved hypothetical protein [Nitrosomonas mobilis]
MLQTYPLFLTEEKIRCISLAGYNPIGVFLRNSSVRSLYWAKICFLSILMFTCSWPISSKELEPIYPIRGTFIQLLENSHGQWSENEWVTFFSYLKKLNISDLYLQWTVADTRSFFYSSTFQTVESPPLETILRLAEQFEIKVNIGLVYDYEYWNQINNNSDRVKIYLEELLIRSKLAAEQIKSIAINYKSFKGWYITEEVDDINWKLDDKRELLFSYLERLSDALEKLTPGYQIAISGFCNGQIQITEFKKFWDQLFKRTKINLALFQDGIGTNKLTFSNLPYYLAAFKKSAIDNQREMGVIVEIFRQVDGYPINKKEFHAVPAELFRINWQRQMASKFSHNIVAFSIPNYMMPIAGSSGNALYNKYLEDIEKEN